MNLNDIKKQYAKLTAPERFALIYAAQARGDVIEARALMDSAPEVTITYPHTLGIREGFRELSAIHRQTMLSAACVFWVTSYWEDDGETDKKLIEGGRELAARNFLETKAAFRAVCQEYKIDPEPLETTIPITEAILGLMEIIIDDVCRLAPIELTHLEELKEKYREVIERARKDCYEDKAR